MLNETTYFHRVTQKRGDPAREPIIFDYHTHDERCEHKGFAFECRPCFASLLKAAPDLLAACKAAHQLLEDDRGSPVLVARQLTEAITKAEQP